MMPHLGCATLLSLPILSFVLSITSATALAPSAIPLSLWTPMERDSFFVDTQSNVGYLIHGDGAFTSFPLLTGQRRVVSYIGLRYDATTPEGEWIVKSQHIQPDRITYGMNGKFLRLYTDGKEYSHYGIHTHRYVEEMIQSGDRFRSMGCIIVSEDIYNLLERTYEKNQGELAVVTKYGLKI